MLFRIEGTDVKLAGAAAAGAPGKPSVPGWLQSVFDGADQAAFPADVEKIDPAAALLPAHQSLTVLSFFEAVAALWKRFELPGSPARMKAWAASTALRVQLAELLAPGAIRVLMREAKRRSLPLEFLESPDARAAAFDAVPLEEQLVRLEQAAARPAEAAAFDTGVYEAWLAHDLEKLCELIAVERRTYPESLRHIVDLRNAAWMPRLGQLIRENTAARRRQELLVVVEAPHLCGAQGLLTLLAAEGWKPTRLL